MTICRSRNRTPTDPYIYHHKWLFVDDDYHGFDVAESKARSEKWIALGKVDRSRIGRRSLWEENVVPRLVEMEVVNATRNEILSSSAQTENQELWVRSEEAGKLLKLSSCDLAHARSAGKIRYKKVGNAFVYLIIQ